MVKSMTGYGQSTLDKEDIGISVEIRTLNSKFLDSIIKLPREFSDKEIEVKNNISDCLIRGKVTVMVNFQRKDNAAVKMEVNEQLFQEYYATFLRLAKDQNSNESDVFKLALQMPEVVRQQDIDDDLADIWEQIKAELNIAIDQCDAFRLKEGEVLKHKLIGYIKNIGDFLTNVDEKDPKRVDHIRERLNQKIEDLERVENVDKNRFEQELIYFIEKLDISEEKVRLKSHLDYFMEVINNGDAQGKKLGFISQEIGREINTIGSKANDAAMQRYVVGMKEELEKIKEQLLNIL